MPLSYVGLRVIDLDRSVRFYTRALGLVERKRGTMSHGGIWVALEDPETHQNLELNWYPPGHPYATPFEPGEALDHIAFDVPDARAKYQDLLREGAAEAIAPWLEEGRIWIGYVKDPEGNWIELQSLAT
jgi:lactoylglutathione lyase